MHVPPVPSSRMGRILRLAPPLDILMRPPGHEGQRTIAATRRLASGGVDGEPVVREHVAPHCAPGSPRSPPRTSLLLKVYHIPRQGQVENQDYHEKFRAIYGGGSDDAAARPCARGSVGATFEADPTDAVGGLSGEAATTRLTHAREGWSMRRSGQTPRTQSVGFRGAVSGAGCSA